MTRNSLAAALMTSTLVLAGLPAASAAQVEIDPRLAKVIEDWRVRRAIPPARHEVEGSTISTKRNIEAYNKARHGKSPTFDAKDYELVWNFRLMLDVKKQRHRFEQDKDYLNIESGEITREGLVSTFDGTALMSKTWKNVDGRHAKLRESDPDLWIVTGNMANSSFTSQLWPLFAGHGVVVFPPRQSIVPGKLDSDPDVTLMTVHRSDLFRGRPCTVLRSYPTDGDAFQEFWIDHARDSALVRWIGINRTFPAHEIAIDYVQQGRYWLVANWIVETRVWFPDTNQSYTSHVYRFKVVKSTFEPNAADSVFRLPTDPGMLITRQHNELDKNPLKKEEAGKVAYFRLDGSGRENSVTIEKGVERSDRNFGWLWLGLAGTAVVLIAWAAWRFRTAPGPGAKPSDRANG